MKKVLITGMSGLIGGILREHLEGLGGYELSALNRRRVEGVECHQADIADLEAIRPAFEIPSELWLAMPFVITIAALASLRGRESMPRYLAIPFARGAET